MWVVIQFASVLGLLFIVIPGFVFTFFLFFRDLLRRCFFGRSRKESANPFDITPSESDIEAGQAMNGVAKSKAIQAKYVASAAYQAAMAYTGPGAATSIKPSPILDSIAENDHFLGLPRRISLATVNAFSIAYTHVLNQTRVYNQKQLVDLVLSRPPGTPLLTVSNHMSTLDDPFLWGQLPLRASDPHLCRWTLTAKDICFINPFLAYFFRMGKCIPIDRWGGIYQPGMFEAVERLNRGDWLHIFPEGRIVQEHISLQRLKWGLASILARATNPPIVLCVGHSGFETIMPEKHVFNRRAIMPLWGKKVSIVVGEPMTFDIPALRREAEEAVANQSEFGKDAITSSPERKLEELRRKAAAGEGRGETGEEVEAAAEAGGGDVETGEVGAVADAGGGKFNSGASTSGEPPPAETEEQLKRKLEQVNAVGDEVTRRLYAHITQVVKGSLEATMFEAHRRQYERKGIEGQQLPGKEKG